MNNIIYINIPTECPVCGQKLIIDTSPSGVKILKCINKDCNGTLLHKIEHFCSKKGINILGFGEKTIKFLIQKNWITKISDIYNLKKYRIEWNQEPGFGENSVNKILESIEKSKKCTLESFISAIGINGVGRAVAKEIVKYYSTWEEFRAAVGGDWTEFEGFGPEISRAINNFDYTEADEIAGMLDFIQPTVQSEATPAAAIKDKIFVITGSLVNYKNRDLLKTEIESLGGKVSSSISSKTNYLINNDINSTSSKNKKAKELGIPIITEEEYLKLRS